MSLISDSKANLKFKMLSPKKGRKIYKSDKLF